MIMPLQTGPESVSGTLLDAVIYFGVERQRMELEHMVRETQHMHPVYNSNYN